MVLAIGIIFMSVAMYAALYFGYLEIEKKAGDLAIGERQSDRASPEPATSSPAADANRPGDAERH